MLVVLVFLYLALRLQAGEVGEHSALHVSVPGRFGPWFSGPLLVILGSEREGSKGRCFPFYAPRLPSCPCGYRDKYLLSPVTQE